MKLFLFFFKISLFFLFSSFSVAQGYKSYSSIISNKKICKMDARNPFKIQHDQAPGENCAGYWPVRNDTLSIKTLPLCKRNSDFSLQYGQIPRKNCHDLIHLPLCSEINDIKNRKAGINCVNECKNLHLSSIRSMPNYGHNYYNDTEEKEKIGCVRFCDNPIRS